MIIIFNAGRYHVLDEHTKELLQTGTYLTDKPFIRKRHIAYQLDKDGTHGKLKGVAYDGKTIQLRKGISDETHSAIVRNFMKEGTTHSFIKIETDYVFEKRNEQRSIFDYLEGE